MHPRESTSPPAAAPIGSLLVFDCHEAWVYQLAGLGYSMDIIVDLKGRAVRGWDTAMRPQPARSRVISLAQALGSRCSYQCVIAHNLSDLLDSKQLAVPRLLMIHSTLEGIAREQGTSVPLDEFRGTVARYLELTGTFAAAVSTLKARSWALTEEIVPLSADPADYLEPTGVIAKGLRVVNQITQKRNFLCWEFHEAAFAGLPITLVGRNDDRPGIFPSSDWNDLKATFRDHRFYIHTADARYEDGYNMAMLEAMAAGLPVLGNCHPTSPITNGVDGFLSDNPVELHRCARLLLNDRSLATKMGHAARQTVASRFSPREFQSRMLAVIAGAQARWRQHRSQVESPRF